MTRETLPTISLVALAALLGCSQDPSEGASTETTNGLSGWVRTADGASLSGARVTIWDSHGDQILSQATTDASGHWSTHLPPGDYGILANSADSQQVAWKFGAGKDQQPIDLLTNPTADITVTGSKKLRLLGTPIRTTNGRFPLVPAGSFTLLSDTGSHSNPIASFYATSGKQDTVAPPADSGVLLEDFDDGDDAFLFGAIGPGGRWFAQTGGYAQLISPLADIPGSVVSALETSGAWSGRSLHLCYSTFGYSSFVQVGFYLRSRTNLSKLRSIRLRAKGDGEFRVQIYGYGSGNEWIHSTWEARPKPTWASIVLKPGDESIDTSGSNRSVPWSQTAPTAAMILIQARGGSSLWIDDLRIDGIDPALFLP